MNPLILAWTLSLAGALAFALAGYLVGRRTIAQGALANQHLPDLPDLAPSRPELAIPPVRVRPKTVDVRFLEGRLVQSLRRLDPDQRLSQLVLCDESGLPIAAADHVPAGTLSEDPEHLSALGAQALALMGRVEAVATSSAVTVELAEGRRLQVRPIPDIGVPLFLVAIGTTVVPDDRFDAFAREVRALITPEAPTSPKDRS